MEAGQFNEFNGLEYNKSQNQRHVDKDGFAFPAPKEPALNRMNFNALEDKNLAEMNGPLDFQTSPMNGALEDKNFEDMNGSLDFQTSPMNGGETVNVDCNNPEGNVRTREHPSENGAASNIIGTRTVKDLVTDFMTEMNSLQQHWGNILSQSEEFEMNTLKKIDAYIAKSEDKIEELESQKKALTGRMRGISGILQDFN